MKQATVYLRGDRAGILTEDENGYTFQYDSGFLTSEKAEAISLTLPLTDRPYRDKVLFLPKAGCLTSLRGIGKLTHGTACPCCWPAARTA